MNSKRDAGIDVLKFIGLVGLIASHTFTNSAILQIRSFDVNLLVIISAFLADKKRSENISYCEYCRKRIKRLLLPTWIFITVYLIINMCFKFQEYSKTQIVRSYLLLNNSIGYVWIIYVYLICALVVPFLSQIETRKMFAKALYIAGTIIYLYLSRITDNYWYQLIVLYPIIYSLISFIGIFLSRNEKKFSSIIMIGGIAIFCVYAVTLYKSTGRFIVTGEYKYPPKLYYLSYSIGISIMLFKMKNLLLRLANAANILGIVSFVSKHSLWIYLWHILALQIVLKLGFGQTLSFVGVVIISMILTFIQEAIVCKLENKNVSEKFLSIFRG